jgi:capsular exopolysaccharide synthesis family protein
MNANMTVTDLREQYEYAAAEQRDLATKMLTYDNMLEEERRLQEDYTKAETYRQELDLTIKAKQTFQVQHTRAVPPKERSTPRWLVNLFVGTAGGLLAAVGLAMLLEFADTSIRTGRDMVRHVRRQLLGIIPDLDDEEVAIDDITSVVRNAPNSMVAEAFRAVRTNLERSAPADERRTLLVTSPRPDDGKTAIAVNLAVAQANNHRRVLLVDANFRKPALHQVFKLPGARGLSDLLAGQGSLETLVAPSGVDRLDVLCCGRIPSNPVEQLGSPAMQSLIDAAAGKYDQVIFDGPPLLLVSDALVVAGAVDGVILVTRAKANSRGVVLRARDGLEHVNARILGTVLNAAQVRRGGYYREQYRAFYDYQAADAGGIATMPASPNTRADDDDNPEPS